MKTIKAVIFVALLLIASASAVSLFLCMCACEVSDLIEYIKMVTLSALAFGASALFIKYLYGRWYSNNDAR